MKLLNKEFWEAALTRCVRTMAQAALGLITTGVLISEINWVAVASTSAVAGIYSLLMSVVTGLPEAK